MLVNLLIRFPVVLIAIICLTIFRTSNDTFCVVGRGPTTINLQLSSHFPLQVRCAVAVLAEGGRGQTHVQVAPVHPLKHHA